MRKFTPVTPSLPVNPIPAQSQTSQPFDSSPMIQDIPEPVVNPMPSSPIPATLRHSDTPDTPASPSFVTPPSSPVQLPDSEASCPSPNPVTITETQPQVRRSTRIRNPPKRYNPAEYDLT